TARGCRTLTQRSDFDRKVHALLEQPDRVALALQRKLQHHPRSAALLASQCEPILSTQIRGLHVGLVEQLLSRSAKTDTSRLQEIRTIAHFQCCECILLDQQYGNSLLADPGDDFENLF